MGSKRGQNGQNYHFGPHMDPLMQVFSGKFLSNMLRIIPDNVSINGLVLGSANTEYKLRKLHFSGFSYTFPIYFLYKILWPQGGGDKS